MEKYLVETLRTEIKQFSQSITKTQWVRPGLSISIKTSWRNIFGIQESLLLIGQVSWTSPVLPDPEGWACVRLEALQGLSDLPVFDPIELGEALSNSRALCETPLPPPIALLHAALTSKYVCFGEPLPILAASCLKNSSQVLHEWFKESALIAPFDADMRRLCRRITRAAQVRCAYVLLNRGLLVGGETSAECCSAFARLAQIAQDRLPAEGPAEEALSPGDKLELPKIRYQISSQRGRPLVLHLDDSAEIRDFIESGAGEQVLQSGLPVPSRFARTGIPVRVPDGEFGEGALPAESALGASILWKTGMGAVAAADSSREAKEASGFFHDGVLAVQTAARLGVYHPLALEDLESAAKWTAARRPELLPFSGEVALVTGAASGIGKSCAESLLRRGSSVIGIDINPEIVRSFDHPCYRGMECDITDEENVIKTLQKAGAEFGGLDILVLNAGLFPGGVHIEKLTLAEFTKVLNINFVANMVILREAFPLLRLAPRYGRVVVVGSKNMRAPGPGAAAYSTSKAAVTQLARVAALEWGGDRVRVNVIHPDAVFDTALYTEEVLKARSAHYGMTVDQYKKRNLLKTEIKSHDVAELVAEMCGPLFQHMTGGQIQIDGGNDRTI